jgi:uncharacterized Zn-finger protein
MLKDAEIARLKANFQLRSEGIRVKGLLYDMTGDGKPNGHPYCPRCEEIDGVRMKLAYDTGERGNAICPQCKTKYRHVTVYTVT